MAAIAIVFGGSSGIGEATAKRLLAADVKVTIVGRDPAKLAQARSRLGAVDTASVDATDPKALKAFFAARDRFDHLVLCQSGGKGAGPFRRLEVADVRSGLEGKLFSQIQTAQAALEKLDPRGSITFVSAGSARSAIPGTAGLAAINGAIEAMVKPLAKELAPIRVNAVSPGIVDTPWWSAMPPEAKAGFFAQAAEQLPVKRVGKPEDVAEAIAMVATNGFITGSVLEVDGGGRL